MLSSVLSATRQEKESRTAKVLRGYSELCISCTDLPEGPKAGNIRKEYSEMRVHGTNTIEADGIVTNYRRLWLLSVCAYDSKQ